MHGPLLPRPRFWLEAAAQKKTRFSVFGELLSFLLVYFIASLIQSFLFAIPTFAWLASSGHAVLNQLKQYSDLNSMILAIMDAMPDWLVCVSIFACAAYGAAAVFYCRKFEKRSTATMGIWRDGAFREYGFGLVLGFALVFAVVGVGSAAKGFRLGAFSLIGQSVPIFLAVFGAYIVEGLAMELLFRGYLTTSLGARMPVAFAIGSSTLIQAMLGTSVSSLTTLGMVNGALLSILLCVYMIKRGNLWGVCAVHAAWNIGINLLFSFTEEGAPLGICLFPIYTSPSQSLLTGAEYGPEASICATVALLAALAVVLALKPADPAPSVPQPEPEEVV